ncbi:hypothetical protein BD309DRAFT_56680 [Dichomitus squalens]|uniref:Uncharacterized protein n=1 Tax=Dichomitus squalens TaxID=114155 RepID=A0A4Q9NRK1_9APHY|nr:hypothetical protein BD309DRAFT_56680 [Dichomitus squalens]TBU61503.1 hypothetical protein BD310DRAFT_197785 [Dichomitus squalens]
MMVSNLPFPLHVMPTVPVRNCLCTHPGWLFHHTLTISTFSLPISASRLGHRDCRHRPARPKACYVHAYYILIALVSPSSNCHGQGPRPRCSRP